MPHDPRKSLHDMLRASRLALQFTAGRQQADYLNDELLRAAVERELEIIGEALNRLFKSVPDLADQISERRAIIQFRNVLAHAYDIVDDKLVWGIVEVKLPILIAQLELMLAALDGSSNGSPPPGEQLQVD